MERGAHSFSLPSARPFPLSSFLFDDLAFYGLQLTSASWPVCNIFSMRITDILGTILQIIFQF